MAVLSSQLLSLGCQGPDRPGSISGALPGLVLSLFGLCDHGPDQACPIYEGLPNAFLCFLALLCPQPSPFICSLQKQRPCRLTPGTNL